MAHRAPDAGIALVQVDGEPPVAVDTWSALDEPQSEAFVRTFPEAGWHVIRVTHSGQASPHAGGAWLRSDGFAWQW